MNGDHPKIEIFEPFGQAFEMMKRILFQPFDFTKWLVIGFAAFLSGHGGTGLGFHSGNNWNLRSGTTGSWTPPYWFSPALVIGIGVGFVLVLLLIWISSRARFIFTDCVVKNRAAIIVPWKEYRREGNSLFLFSLVVGLTFIVIVGLVMLLVFVPLHAFHERFRIAGVFGIILVGLVAMAGGIFLGVVADLMIPVIYRRRCLAREAFVDVVRLIFAQPVPIVLFVLFGIVLIIAFVITCTIVTCLTCCMAGIPYVSSVVFLPVFVWFLCFKLLFLRQFGLEFDVWATIEVPPVVMPQLPPEPPIEPTTPTVDV